MFGRAADDSSEWASNWIDGIAERARQAQDLADQVAALTETATCAYGDVQVTVAASGAMTDLRLHENVRARPADEIASTILDTMRRAQGRLAGRIAELTEQTVGADSEAGRALVESYSERFGEDNGLAESGDRSGTGRPGGGWGWRG